MGSLPTDDEIRFGSLTKKQREVLDLLIEHKTSKEIARALRISPYTVDQRINFARSKLGVASRNEAAAAYRRLAGIYGQSVYRPSDLSHVSGHGDDDDGTREGLNSALTAPNRTHSDDRVGPMTDYQVVPELFEGRYGTLMRLGAIIIIAVFLVFLVLGGLAIFSELSEMMAS